MFRTQFGHHFSRHPKPNASFAAGFPYRVQIFATDASAVLRFVRHMSLPDVHFITRLAWEMRQFPFPFPMRYTALVDFRDGIERRIEAKRKEVGELELKIREQMAYIRALEDTLRLFEGGDAVEDNGRGIRPDSDVGKAQAVLKSAGRPMHISDLWRRFENQMISAIGFLLSAHWAAMPARETCSQGPGQHFRVN